MSEQLEQDAVTTTTDEELELDLNLDDTEDVEALKEKIAKKDAFARQAIARAKKAEEALKEANKPKPQTITNDDGSKSYNILDDDIADMLLDGYTKNEVKFVMANGGRKALEDKDSFVSIAIEAKRQQRKAEEAASQTTHGGGSEIEKKYTKEQLNNMSSAELKKLLPHA